MEPAKKLFGEHQEVVETERLIMRRLLPEDYKAMAAWDMDERVYKYLLGSACRTPEEPLSWLPKKDPASKVNILMLVSAKEDGHAVGIYALNHDMDRDVWTLSYVNRYDDWGKGYTAEGMKALMDHAVEVYGARVFEGECARENTGSRRVMEKLEMKYDHSSSYTKNDGSATFESDVYTLTVSGEKKAEKGSLIMYRIFDAHCHIYPESIALKAIEGIDQFYQNLPFDPYDGTTGTLLKIGSEAGISHFVVHSVATVPHQTSSINRFIASKVTFSNGIFTGLGTLHPDSENLEQNFGELVSLGLKGVKIHPDFQRFEADSAKAMHIYGLCAEAGLPVLVHTGDSRFDYSNPDRIAKILKAFPKLKFIGAHFGGWSVWDEAVSTLSGYDNLIVDTSSTFYALGLDKSKELIRKWGADRVMFGSDYPMWKPQPDIDCLIEMGLTEKEYRRIFWDNAVNIYGLGDK